ncbi:MAG TPA: hypothetical protein PKD52_04950 [Clostridiales bacterium]|nr:hypothetical protein [Clostridiales bacterium]
MKKRHPFSLLIGLIFTIWICFSAPLCAAENIGSSSAVLIDADTGQILYGKNPYRLSSAGDFNKLLNIITALKTADAPKNLTVSEAALKIYTSPPNLGLKAGESVSLTDMLFAAYLEGHNDAANVVAENIGRLFLNTTDEAYTALTETEKTQAAIDAYVRQMNLTADELCASTMKATNADGHYYDTQQTSCLDVAKLIKNGWRTESFQALFTTGTYTIAAAAETSTEGEKTETGSASGNTDAATDSTADATTETTTGSTNDQGTAANSGKITLNSSNRLFNGSILYAGIQGGISAYNSSSEKYHCAVYATVDDRNLIAVAMNGTQTGVYDDIQALLNFGFYKWGKASISTGELSSLLPDDISALNLAFTGNRDFLLPTGYRVKDLEAAVAYTENGYLSGTITLTLPQDASYAGTITKISFYEKNERSPWGKVFKIIGLVLLILIAVAAALFSFRYLKGRNKDYVKRIHQTAQKEKEKYMKRLRTQTSSLYQEKGGGKQEDPYAKKTYVAGSSQNKDGGTRQNKDQRRKPPKPNSGTQQGRNRKHHQ